MPVLPTVPLTVLGRPAPERSDARRNRRLLLDAAQRIVAERGAEALSTDALAAAAGVGKGTVFRRFGSRAGVFLALLDEVERESQRACLSGPPPLGPGADPVERLVAFGLHRLEFARRQCALLRAASGAAAPDGRPDAASRLHVRVLLRQAGVGADGDVLAALLVAALAAPRLTGGAPDVPAEDDARWAAGWTDLVHRVVRPR